MKKMDFGSANGLVFSAKTETSCLRNVDDDWATSDLYGIRSKQIGRNVLATYKSTKNARDIAACLAAMSKTDVVLVYGWILNVKAKGKDAYLRSAYKGWTNSVSIGAHVARPGRKASAT